MDFKRLTAKAKDAIDKRGGMDSLKADAEELKKVAKGKGSMADKAKATAAALKDPGAKQRGAEEHEHKPQPAGERHPAKGAGDPADTVRKGGAPYA